MDGFCHTTNAEQTNDSIAMILDSSRAETELSSNLFPFEPFADMHQYSVFCGRKTNAPAEASRNWRIVCSKKLRKSIASFRCKKKLRHGYSSLPCCPVATMHLPQKMRKFDK